MGAGSEGRRRPLLEGDHPPFSGEGEKLIAAYADKRIDVSALGEYRKAPEAVEAILDYHYPDGRHRDDFLVARYRLQLIAELDVGTQVRAYAEQQDQKVRRLKGATVGTR